MLDPETWNQLDEHERELVGMITDVYSGEVLWDDGVSSTRAEAGDRLVEEIVFWREDCPRLRGLAPRLRAEGRELASRPATRDRVAPPVLVDMPPGPGSAEPAPRPGRPLLPRRPGPPPLTDDRGVVYDYMLGVGYRPRTHFGIEVRDTTISGIPRRDASIGPPQPARIPGGPVITGLSAHLYRRSAQRSPFAR